MNVDGSVVLFYDVVAIVHLADGDRRATLRIKTPDGCGIGLAGINRNVLEDAMTADGFWSGSAWWHAHPGARYEPQSTMPHECVHEIWYLLHILSP